ncbi:hypothetical protein K4F52_002438 [Lecanicillium sp. MT-2017a]|nr:hypothetical protein K4F52_002438 [Lecanicillium sp. MT-2017a]
MSSPSPRPPNVRRPSLVAQDDGHFHSTLPTRTGTLTSMMRSRSQQSLNTSWHGGHGVRHSHGFSSDDEESGRGRARARPGDDDDIERLLRDETRLSQILGGPQNRSMNLIGKSNPRYRWERYWKSEDELLNMKKPIRKYYERTNDLIQQYMYIDCLLDSSIPHDLLNEYHAELEASAFKPVDVPATIAEEDSSSLSNSLADRFVGPTSYGSTTVTTPTSGPAKTPPLPPKRTPKDIFKSSEHLPSLTLTQADTDDEDDHDTEIRPGERRPLLPVRDEDPENGPRPLLPWLEDAEIDSDDPVVRLAIYINLIANVVLLAGKIAVIISVPSMSVLASLVDAVLDFLSTAIVWTTTRLISSSQSDYRYPVGRRRLEPLGVLVFSVIMVTSFVQVGLQCIQRLAGPEHEMIQLGVPAIVIMVGTIVIKGACWLWCRMVKNSSVRALADDAKTDVIFNIGSILFPIAVGFYGRVWWLDATGGLLLSLIVIATWSQTSAHHVRNLTGFSADQDERNLLLYLTMRFATAIRQIQNLRAYHAGDKLFVEVDIVLSPITPLKDSHDLSEVLTYFLESVPIVDRAFVHVDYTSYNAPTHMLKQSST